MTCLDKQVEPDEEALAYPWHKDVLSLAMFVCEDIRYPIIDNMPLLSDIEAYSI